MVRSNKFKLILIFCVTLIISIPMCMFDFTFNPNVEKYLANKYKSEYPYIYNYSYIELLGLKIINVDMLEPVTITKEFKGSDKDKVRQVVSYINSFNYKLSQAEPSKLETLGGNCQAKATFLQQCLNKYNIENSIEYTKDHMYNVVIIGNEKLTIDLVQGTIKGGKL